jgi:two-component system, sensor histidine kinase and response regulator
MELHVEQKPPADRLNKEPDSPKLNILLVEDEVVNQRYGVLLMERRGHKVTIAANGLEALEAIENNSFDIIMMDLMMPEMDGFEATKRIRNQEKSAGGHIPIIAVTASALKDDHAKCLAAGMDEYVAKASISSASLCRLVEQTASAGVESPRKQTHKSRGSFA